MNLTSHLSPNLFSNYPPRTMEIVLQALATGTTALALAWLVLAPTCGSNDRLGSHALKETRKLRIKTTITISQKDSISGITQYGQQI